MEISSSVVFAGHVTDLGPSKRKNSMIYAPDGAKLKVDGKTIPALPQIWQLGASNTQLNQVDLMDRKNKQYYLAFPVKLLQSDSYVFHPGTAIINGVSITLPNAHTCHSSEAFFFSDPRSFKG
jgi:hypothetical protein